MSEKRTNGGHNVPADLAEAVDRLADQLEDVHRHAAGGVVEYVRGATVFAVTAGREVSFHLLTELAEAALRTPDTGPSTRGPGWVSLHPPAVDGFALDRALAWFESAWRLAGQSGYDAPPRARPN